MARYSDAVEQWRDDIIRIAAELGVTVDVDKVLYVLDGESKGNPNAHNTVREDSAGLFQLKENGGLGTGMGESRFDPDINIRTALRAIADHGYTDWGEGVLSESGEVFGALGHTPYPGPDLLEDTVGDPAADLDMLPGGSGPAPVSRPSSEGGLLDDPLAPVNPQGVDWGKLAAENDLYLQELLANRPDARDFNDDDAYQEALDSWGLLKDELIMNGDMLRSRSEGMLTLPDGTVVPLAGISPEIASAIDKSNLQLYRDRTNAFNIGNYDLDTDRRVTDYNNRVTEFNGKINVEGLNERSAASLLDREMKGLIESRMRSDFVTASLLDAAPYATPNGQTSFSPNDLGSGISGFGDLLGIDNSQGILNYPGTIDIDPQGLLSQYDDQFGVGQSALPAGYVPQMTMDDVPVSPGMPSLPDLLGPVQNTPGVQQFNYSSLDPNSPANRPQYGSLEELTAGGQIGQPAVGTAQQPGNIFGGGGTDVMGLLTSFLGNLANVPGNDALPPTDQGIMGFLFGR